MLARLIGFFRTSVDIILAGSHREQLLNVLRRQKIEFWGLHRVGSEKIGFSVRQRDVKKIQIICERYFAEIEVYNNSGIQKITRLYGRRWGLLCGGMVALLLFCAANCFIWDVRVEGCEEKTNEIEILRQFKELGLDLGTFRWGIDMTSLEDKFLMGNHDVVWVSINVKFTTAYIELHERKVTTGKIYDLTTPCDIYAARDGHIVSMMITSGTPLVSVGDSVLAGEKLVSREYLDRYGKTIIVHSIAKIEALTQRTLTAAVPLQEIRHIPTGRKKSFYELNIFNFKIPLYFKENIIYNKYDLTYQHHKLRIGHFALPVSIAGRTYIEVEHQAVEIDLSKAKVLALAQIEKQEKEQLFDVEILDVKINEEIVDGQLCLTAEYSCKEDISLTLGD